ncbi:ammonia channel protein [Asticcacaulis sp. AC466]|uniref:ammonium transporter n=1 Tax=Asticcacaulis sp. AC466 TaxID=1282362 RepID=UPI0003C3EC5E|nr:ammonium transporter [Asticcacaulis sp. AC466]ESQ84331.1 ammonia channel protein [Asticcacaulis sp. AC466]
MLAAPVASHALAQEAASASAEAVTSAAASVEESATASVAAEPAAEAPALLASQKPLELDAADTTYLIFCTAMVLMMTLPGLALFYGGMVRRKNIIATVTQSVGVTCVVAIVWWVVSYSMAFGTAVKPMFGLSADTLNLFFGGFDNIMLKAVTPTTAYMATAKVPEFTWISYQMTFAIITPALITGAFAERVKFSGLLLFMVLWSILVYAPICHMVWGGGLLSKWGVLDFAGGAVVHCNSGVAGLVCALFLGRRKGYGTDSMPANNPVYIMIGASLLFVGWIGFNAGSEWSGDSIASAALLNTILATCVGGVSWKIVEWIFRGKPSLIGILSGMVAGLVVITPACGFVNPTGAMICGVLAGPVCYASATWIKKLLGYDDSLDAFGIHGAGGILGAILTGWLADPVINSLGKDHNVMAQLKGLAVTILWSAIGTLIILIICKFTTGLRVTADEEEAGLDSSLHDEVMDH